MTEDDIFFRERARFPVFSAPHTLIKDLTRIVIDHLEMRVVRYYTRSDRWSIIRNIYFSLDIIKKKGVNEFCVCGGSPRAGREMMWGEKSNNKEEGITWGVL